MRGDSVPGGPLDENSRLCDGRVLGRVDGGVERPGARRRFPGLRLLQEPRPADLPKKRPGHARCIACHGQGTPLRLQPPTVGGTAWSEEDSRKNFELMRRVVQPGNPKSRLLVHALDEKAGGDFYHNGGKHWSTQDDPEWQILRTWVMGLR